MPPRKTKKADEGESSEVMNQRLLMDTREVEAKAPAIDPAEEAKRLDAAVEEARIGIGYINVLTMSNELLFRRYNERPEKDSETNKMLTSFDLHGIQSLKEANALCIIIKRSRIASGQTLTGQWTKEESLHEIEFNDRDGIVIASGQHRVAALKKMNKNTLDELSSLVKRNEKLTDLQDPTEEQVEEQHDVREQIAEAKGKLKKMGKWGVILYDEDILLKDSKDLARHLSRNQTLHVYAETAEELLMTVIRNLEDACDVKGEVGAKERLAVELLLPDRSKNTRLTRVLHMERLMICLVKDLLPLGDHFRRRSEFKASWLARNIDVQMGMHVQFIKRQVIIMRNIVSEDPFATRVEVKAALKEREEKTPKGAAAWARLRKWREEIIQSEPGDHSIFADFIPAFNDLALKLCSDGATINWEEDYIKGLGEYTREVCDHLGSVWLSKGNKKESPEKTKFFEAVLARILVLMTPDKERDYLPVPLLTGCVLDYAWSSMSAVAEGLKEVARWFEPLIDWHKLLWQQSHAMDDASETIFRALERDKGYDGYVAVNKVYNVLWRERERLLLPLHNRMSSPAMQAVMKSRPIDRAGMKSQLDGLEEALHLSTNTMFNVAKKMTGKKQTEPTTAEMKTLGMHALVASAPDWRKESTAKNRLRDLRPMIQAITLEVLLVEKYREDLIESSALVALLREELQIELHTCERITQMSLVPSTSQQSGSQVAKLGVKKRVVFWDRIPLPEKSDDTDKRIAEEMKVQHLRTKRQLDREGRDREAIKKIVSSCISIPIARINYGSQSGVAVEVADAVNALIKAYELNSARLRLRELHDDDSFVFNTAVDIEKLVVDEVKGVDDENTLKPQPAAVSGDPHGSSLSAGQPKRKPKPKPVQKKASSAKGKETEVVVSDTIVVSDDVVASEEVVASDDDVHQSVTDHDVHEDIQHVELPSLPTVAPDITGSPQHGEQHLRDTEKDTPIDPSLSPTSAVDIISTSAPSDSVPSQPLESAPLTEKTSGRQIVKKGAATDAAATHDHLPDINLDSDFSDMDVSDITPHPEHAAIVSDSDMPADTSAPRLGKGRGKGVAAPKRPRDSTHMSLGLDPLPTVLPSYCL